ncbi:MAG: flagellar hook-basal body complex protein FliE [Armatimonadetes bacterium]|nr:flagellar hook-basal body complex protein FliE [Armatimonadota bacterium]
MRIDGAASAAKSIANPLNGQKASGDDFGQMLMDAIKDVNEVQQKSEALQNDLMAGRPVETANLMIAMQQASTAMNLTLQVRNKLLEAYQEISRMNV